MQKLIPEDIVECIIDFKCGTSVYRKNKKQHHKMAAMVFWELKRWYTKGWSIGFLKATYSQRRRGKLFLKSLKEGSPAIIGHVGLFRNKEEAYFIIESSNKK
tara:strand:- start:4406 stop:4711 length:306 start_codon:yes stop_codon:yes gene_type:complete